MSENCKHNCKPTKEEQKQLQEELKEIKNLAVEIEQMLDNKKEAVVYSALKLLVLSIEYTNEYPAIDTKALDSTLMHRFNISKMVYNRGIERKNRKGNFKPHQWAGVA